MTKMQGKAIEFFAGMGLVRLALEQTGFRVIYANDIDGAKARLYRAMFRGEDHFDHRDIHDVAPTDLPGADIWTASFPCTDLSLAGGRAGIRGGQSGAVWRIFELLDATPPRERPRYLFFENVVGLLSSHGGADFRALVRAVNERGYGVDVMRVDAARFTPQSRARLFLIATEQSARGARAVDPLELAPTDARPAMVLEAMRSAPDCVWHARKLARLPERTQSLADVIDPLPDDAPQWWSAERTKYFCNQIHPNHVERVEALRREPRITHVTAFRRVRAIDGEKRSVAEIRFDGVAGCLRTPKGGSAKQILVRLGHGDLRVRHLTARECLRLQGVACDPPPGATEDELLFALGDAVCVPAVKWALDQLDAPMIASDVEHPIRSAPASNIAIAAS